MNSPILASQAEEKDDVPPCPLPQGSRFSEKLISSKYWWIKIVRISIS